MTNPTTEQDLSEWSCCDEHGTTYPIDGECHVCRNLADERAYDRDMSEPTFRGGEYEASVRRELAEARKLK